MERTCKVVGCDAPTLPKRRSCKFHHQQDTNASVRRMRERSPERFKSYTLTRDYGIDLEYYSMLLVQQNGACIICGCLNGSERSNNNGSKVLSVDHDHKTGTIRGLLCSMCNKGIGSLNDSPGLLRKAADYLERHADKQARIAQYTKEFLCPHQE